MPPTGRNGEPSEQALHCGRHAHAPMVAGYAYLRTEPGSAIEERLEARPRHGLIGEGGAGSVSSGSIQVS